MIKCNKSLAITVIVFLFGQHALAQDDLMALLDAPEPQALVMASWKGTHVINGHSTKTKNKGELDFLIYHRFGPVNSGIQEFFGLDQANMRLGFEYGLSGTLDLGLGRSTFQKTYDGYVKWKFFRQQKGKKNIALSMVLLSAVAIPTANTTDPLTTVDRMSYTNQLILSRKFGSNFTLQLMPGLVHLNTVPTNEDPNDIVYLGGAFRYKITASLALTGEYYHRFNPIVSVENFDVVGIGVDIETGGHVFQLHLTNSRPTFESGFITNTTDNFWDGDIRFGFNISRTFQIANKK
jgi:hypothetical protein